MYFCKTPKYYQEYKTQFWINIIVPTLCVGMRLEDAPASLFQSVFYALTMKTLVRQRVHSNAERWNNDKYPQSIVGF
jgi:hypothetical protein